MEIKIRNNYMLFFLFIISILLTTMIGIREGYYHIILVSIIPLFCIYYLFLVDLENNFYEMLFKGLGIFIICLFFFNKSIEIILLSSFNLYIYIKIFKIIQIHILLNNKYFKINFIHFLFFKEKYFYEKSIISNEKNARVIKSLFESYLFSKYNIDYKKHKFNIYNYKIYNSNESILQKENLLDILKSTLIYYIKKVLNKKRKNAITFYTQEKDYIYFLIRNLKEKSILIEEEYNKIFDFEKYMNTVEKTNADLLTKDIIYSILLHVEFNQVYLNVLLNKKNENINENIKKIIKEYMDNNNESYYIETFKSYLISVEQHELEQELKCF